MPLLGPDDPLPHPPRRVAVSGTSGSGKSTLARTVAAATGAPYLEIDSLYHGPEWVPRKEFLDDLAAFTAGPAWVTEWQYKEARPSVARLADTMVWLDHSRPLVMARLLRRTVRRRRSREPLWNGNVETGLWNAFTDREDVLWWAWNTHHDRRRQVLELVDGPLTVVRLRGQRQVDTWLAGPLAAACGGRATG